MHVLDVQSGHRKLVITVETEAAVTGCPSCGDVATGHGRRRVRAADAPCFGVAVLLIWLKRVWRCVETDCPQLTWSETHELVGTRAVLTSRAVVWAVDALAHDDTTVSALARHLRVDWHTLWRAIKADATDRISRPGRLTGVRTLGVDEHIWRPGQFRANERAVTSMVDLTRDADGRLHARLLDVRPGRSGTVYAGWLGEQTKDFIDAVEHAALDPFRGYANAIRDELPDAVAVLDAFHVVRLGTQALDEVRRRVQQDTLGHRGMKHDPLYKIRGLLRHGVENLTERQITKLNTCLEAGDPDWAVTVAWQCYQQLRQAYATKGKAGREIAEKIIASFPSCPIPEVARLGRTLRQWRQQVLAYFDTSGVSNGGTEAINLLIEKTRRLAHGFRNFNNYRLRILLVADGSRDYRRQ
ncbi:MAG: ISL3 family transposase [Pseudonocardiales bacterium]|nr:MAG: ISL3 family transposase [Pseudonocardiales bacterium]